jgi:hypothetical protein
MAKVLKYREYRKGFVKEVLGVSMMGKCNHVDGLIGDLVVHRTGSNVPHTIAIFLFHDHTPSSGHC